MPDSRNLPSGRTPEAVLAGQVGRLMRQVADLRSTIAARPRGQVPTTTTATRPDAVAVGAGAQRFDTTLGQPIWSDGSVWVDATGTAV